MKRNTILHAIAKQLVRNWRTPVRSAAYSSALTSALRVFVVLLLPIVGVNGAWGQTDYSGTYYIASGAKSENNGSDYTYNPDAPANNFYLCPTKGWIYYQSGTPYFNNNTNTPEQPFLTTFKCRSGATDPTTGNPYDEREAKWTLIKHPSQDCYYIRRNIDGKYLTLNRQLGSNAGTNRLRFHIEATNSPGEDHLFAVESNSTNLAISAINAKASNKTWYLNVHQGNFPAITGVHANDKNQGPTGYEDIGGTIGIWDNKDDQNAPWYLEDIILPIIEQQDNNTITITCPGCSVYYTTNGSTPNLEKTGDGNPTQVLDGNITTTITMSNPVTTIKAIAVKAAGTDEVLDTYSRCVTLTTQRYIGPNYPYLFQNVECTDYYMIPGDVKSGNTEVNTSSLFRPTMSWHFSNAGSTDGVQYYYIINGSTGGYLYFTSGNVYMKTNGEFSDSDDGYKFSIVQGYGDDSNPDGFHIVPKAKSSDNTYCIYKGGWDNNTTPITLANSKADVMKGSSNARRSEQKHTRWIFIDAPDNKLPASLTYNSDNPTDENWPVFLSSSTTTKYFKIENVGTAGRYICPPEGNAAVGTATSGDNELAWYIVEAGHDDWRKYYYVVHASTGKYLKFNQNISDPPSSMQGKNSVLWLLDYDSSESDRYQFVFAKSTVDGEYYIVPKGLEEATYNSYYALYLDATNASTLEQPIKSTKNRLSDSYKWKFVAADLFCNNPEFVEEEGSIKIKCNTNAANIYINTESDADPATDNDHLYDPTNISEQNWTTADKVRIKAVAVVSDGTDTRSSSVVTLLNNPDITLGGTAPYTYKGSAWEPGVTEVSIGEAPNKTSATSGYAVSYSDDHTNAGEVTVNVTDNVEDNLFIKNASTTFTIERKAVTITASDASKTYNGSALTEAGFTPGALETGDTYTFTVVMTEGSTITNVGTQFNVISTVDGVAVTTGTETPVGNYLVTTANGTLTINPKAVTITANDASKTYNGSALTEADFTPSALETGDTHTFTVVMTEGSTITNVGTQFNVISTVDGVAVTTGTETPVGNYLVTTANGTLTINPKAVTITANDASKVYDGTPLTGGFTSTDLEAGDTHTFTVEMTAESTITNAGTQPNVIATVDGVAVATGTATAVGNYLVTTVNGTLTISPISLGSGITPASGITINIDESTSPIAITVTHDSNTLTESSDYTITTVGSTDDDYNPRYDKIRIQGIGNYEGDLFVKYAKTNFESDGSTSATEWSCAFVAEENHAIPTISTDTDIAAYTVNTINGNEVSVFGPLPYIPANEPILLLANKDLNGFRVETPTAAALEDNISGWTGGNNKLKVVSESTPGYDSDSESAHYKTAHFNVATIYLLHMNEFVLNKDGYLAKGWVYLPVPSGSGSSNARLRIRRASGTGVNEIQEDNDTLITDDRWYTLDGRRLNGKPTKKGLYLKEGKKVVIK